MSDIETVNSVKVVSVDEEKLKFRVIVSLNGQLLADQDSKGRYNFQIPIPTAIGNSYMFNQAVMFYLRGKRLVEQYRLAQVLKLEVLLQE